MAAHGCEDDFHPWAQHQARLLREKPFAAPDLDHMVEEVEGRVDLQQEQAGCPS